MSGVEVAFGECYIHKGRFAFDPTSVVVVLIDPQTGRPPDVDAEGQQISPPDPEAVERSVKIVICDPCVQAVNRRKAAQGKPTVETSATLRMWGK